MTIGASNAVNVNDLLLEHNSDGTHKKCSNLNYGLASAKTATPTVGDIFLATDRSSAYVCYTTNNWTEIVPGDDFFIKVNVNDTTAENLDDKITGGAGVTKTTEGDPDTDQTLRLTAVGLPSDSVFYYNAESASSLPDGYTVDAGSQGRFILGLTDSATGSGGTKGTILTDLEERAHTHVGTAHTHTVAHTHAMGGHTHTIPAHEHGLSNLPLATAGTWGVHTGTNINAAGSTGAASGTFPSATGTLDSAGDSSNTGSASVGDFFPYIQFLPIRVD
jgi:hypothetical protein